MHTTGDVNIWSESFGRAGNPAILLIMGAMNQGVFWPDDFCVKLAMSGFFVIRYDHRDTGMSDGFVFQHSPYDLFALKDDTLAVLDSYGVSKAVIVGLSMGGYITQLAAIENPERISKVVLISTSADHRPYMAATMDKPLLASPLPAPTGQFLDYIKHSVQSPPTTAEEGRDLLLNGWRATYGGSRTFPAAEIGRALALSEERARDDVSPMNHALATAASPDRLELVRGISMPALVIHGKYDPCLPLAHGVYLSEEIPNAVLSVLDMGHSFQWSWDNEIADKVIDFAK